MERNKHRLYLIIAEKMVLKEPSIHIGTLIKQKVKEKGISVKELAKKIHYTPRNVYQIFNKEDVDLQTLEKISKVINEDLLLEYLLMRMTEHKNDKHTSKEETDYYSKIKELFAKLKLPTQVSFPVRPSSISDERKNTSSEKSKDFFFYAGLPSSSVSDRWILPVEMSEKSQQSAEQWKELVYLLNNNIAANIKEINDWQKKIYKAIESKAK